MSVSSKLITLLLSGRYSFRRITSGRYNSWLPSKYIELTEPSTWKHFRKEVPAKKHPCSLWG